MSMWHKLLLTTGVSVGILIPTFCFGFYFITAETAIEDEQLAFETTGKYIEIKETDGKRVDAVIKWRGEKTTPLYGYAIIEETETKIISTGYGDLSKELTYTYDKPIKESSTTDSGI